MKRLVIPSHIGFALICAAVAAGCGSVQGKSDGSAGGVGGNANGGAGAGAAGTTGVAGMTGVGGGAAGTGVAAGTGGHGGGPDTGGRGGATGGGGGMTGETCGMATCAPGQPCCNASCGLCMQPGAVCTQQVCSDLRWYYTCGTASICTRTDAGTADAGSSLAPCGPDDTLNGACPTLGKKCDPRDNTCGRVFVCATEPSICPF